MRPPVAVTVVRLLFLLICEAVGVIIALSTQGGSGDGMPVWGGLLLGIVVAACFIFAESLMKEFTLRGFSTATFGLLVGLFCAFLLTRIGLSDMLAAAVMHLEKPDSTRGSEFAAVISLAMRSLLYAGFGFLGAVLALRSSRDDFAFILPYVRFRQDGLTGQPIILDKCIVLDGRIPAVVQSGFISGRLILPQFILDELHGQTESSDPINRQQAVQALALLEVLRSDRKVEFSTEQFTGAPVDQEDQTKIIQMAKVFGSRLLTTDVGLAKIARLQGVEVLELNELEAALQREVAVGQSIRIPLVRTGKDAHQAVGYASDGTMIVVNHAIDKIGQNCRVRLISTLQTASGIMIFAELEE